MTYAANVVELQNYHVDLQLDIMSRSDLQFLYDGFNDLLGKGKSDFPNQYPCPFFVEEGSSLLEGSVCGRLCNTFADFRSHINEKHSEEDAKIIGLQKQITQKLKERDQQRQQELQEE